MAKRTQVKKCSVFWNPSFRAFLDNKLPNEILGLKGLLVAMQWMSAIQYTCFVGVPFYRLPVGNSLPATLSPMHKLLEGDYFESKVIIEALLQSSRVECRIDFNTDHIIRVDTFFFKKARDLTLTVRVNINLKSGDYCGGSLSLRS
jgi:hypothetical protein